MNTSTYISFDGAELFFREWNFKDSQKTIIVLHRGHEHSGRLDEFATDDRFKHFNVFAYDFRGHGYTKQEISPIFMDYERDLDCFVKHLKQAYKIEERDVFVVANSISSVVASAWVHDFAPRIAGMGLLAPAFAIRLYVPFAKEYIKMGTKMYDKLNVTSYVKSKVLTHDEAQQKAYDSDKLITKSINAKMLVECIEAGERVVRDAAAINTPTLIFSAGKDYVVDNGMQKKFFVALESEVKEFIELKEFFHGVLFEKDRSIVYDHIERFANLCFSIEKKVIDLKPDKFSMDEFHTLSLKQIPQAELMNYAFQKWYLGKTGSVSDGMALGLKYGFDSGISLDYVYKNTPSGKFGIGKMVDQAYLNAIGWIGIRIRKQHLLQQIDKEISRLENLGLPIKILDIAGGTGNYLFDVKKKYPQAEIVINDFKKENIAAGEKVIADNNIEGVRFTNYDCFDKANYAKLNFNPTITIISGIFELFENNETVNDAIAGVVSILNPNGAIIYTGQPWHPQLKMIAYVLNSHKEKDWVMRRRAQKELDKLFAFNNLEKKEMLIDDYGIFTVSSCVLKETV